MIKKLLISIFFIYVVLVAALTVFQEKMIFLPSKLPQGYEYVFNTPFEEINLTSQDGAQLNAIHFKAANPKGIVLYFHGNAGDLSRWGKITTYFTKFNLDVLVMDYRTYGKSTGSLSEELLYKDAQLFYDYLKKNYHEKEIIVYGRSLGTTFATYVAANNNPRQLILETPFYSLSSLAKKQFPVFPVAYMMRYEFKTHEFIKKVSCNITVIHGTEDQVVPYTSGKKLFEVAPQKRNNL